MMQLQFADCSSCASYADNVIIVRQLSSHLILVGIFPAL